jgi:ribosomal peptide maturation radical SAM protein 1
MTELCARYKSPFIEMVDNILDMHYFRDLIPELKKRSLKLGLFYETKANLTREQVHALHEAGIHTIQPGIESFSTNILRIMRKGTTGVQNIQLLKWCKELGVQVVWNLIYGFPGESPADYEETARIVDYICHLQPPFGLGAIRLDRFSPNFVTATELGLCNVRPDRSYEYIYDLPKQELFDLAYYFEHDYIDGRDPQKYVIDAYKAVKLWQAEPKERSLVYADHGEMVAIWDFRSHAEKTVTILKGCEKDIYLYCDQNRSLQHIRTFLSERGAPDMQVEEFLERLIASRLMIKLDARYLSLAVRTATVASHKTPAGIGSRTPDHVLL